MEIQLFVKINVLRWICCLALLLSLAGIGWIVFYQPDSLTIERDSITVDLTHSGDTENVYFTLTNYTRKPIRLVGSTSS